ncbi:MAG: hypothetical protein RPR40_13695 [Bermanella sp.]
MSKICLYHADHPKGKIFNLGEAQDKFEELKEAGWVDSPASLDIQKEPTKVVIAGGAESLHPEALIGMVKEMGFKVLTEEQLQAEVTKHSHVSLNLEDVNDESLKAEYMRRFGNNKTPGSEGEDSILVKLMARFDENPEALNKEELVMLGREKYGLKLNMNMKEETVIEKIIEAEE